jgi:tetratricopeptide (TPR) repeat protein
MQCIQSFTGDGYELEESLYPGYSRFMASPSHKVLLSQALAAGADRNYAKAEELLTKIIAETESLPETWLYLGRTRHAMGFPERAIPAFRVYVERCPSDANGWFFLGRSFLGIGLAREASRCLGKASELGKHDAETWALSGFAELKLKRPSRARACLEEAVQLAPDNQSIHRGYVNALFVEALRVLNRGDPAAASHMIAYVIAEGHDGLAQRLYRARAYKEQGRLSEALGDLEAAMKMSPDDSSLRIQAAALKFSLGDARAAVADMQATGLKLPGLPESSWSTEALERWRVIAAMEAGDFKAALGAATERLRKGDKDAAIRAVAAQSNFELGRFERAVAHFKLAAEADPKAPDLRMGLALAYWETGQYAEAKAAANSAVKRGAKKDKATYLDVICDAKLGADAQSLLPRLRNLLQSLPGDPRLMLIYAESLYKTGRPDLAEAWFKDFLYLEPDHELARLYMISIAESLGNQDELAGNYKAYLSAYPDNSTIRREYVELLAANRTWKEAAIAIEEGYAYGVTGRKVDAMLALCYRNSGRYRDAAALYRKLLQGDPKNTDLLLGLAWSMDRSGAKTLALELLERGAAYIAKEAEPYLALGALQAKAGMNEKAVAAFSKAVELAPADPRPLRNLARLYDKAGIATMATKFRSQADALEIKTGNLEKRRKI